MQSRQYTTIQTCLQTCTSRVVGCSQTIAPKFLFFRSGGGSGGLSVGPNLAVHDISGIQHRLLHHERSNLTRNEHGTQGRQRAPDTRCTRHRRMSSPTTLFGTRPLVAVRKHGHTHTHLQVCLLRLRRR